MTKKHFIALAAEIRAIANPESRRDAAVAVARICARFNPRFSLYTFAAAAGVPSEILKGALLPLPSLRAAA